MSMPFYVSPEQQMKDRADYARKGIARGRSVLVLTYNKGVLFVGENPSRALHKISEIYDRIAFAAVGKYNEFENLRIAGVRYADLRGYSYDRRDVTGRGLANAFAQTLGTVFSGPEKPYEVEIVVAEVGESSEEDQIYRLTYDGSVADERGFVAMGGLADPISAALQERWRQDLTLREALALAVELLSSPPEPGGERRDLAAPQLEVAVLDRGRPRRTFRRLVGATLQRLLDGETAVQEPRTDDPATREVSPPTSLAGGAHEPVGPERHGDGASATDEPVGPAGGPGVGPDGTPTGGPQSGA